MKGKKEDKQRYGFGLCPGFGCHFGFGLFFYFFQSVTSFLLEIAKRFVVFCTFRGQIFSARHAWPLIFGLSDLGLSLTKTLGRLRLLRLLLSPFWSIN